MLATGVPAGTVGGHRPLPREVSMESALLPSTLLLYAVAIALPLFVVLLVASARRGPGPPHDPPPDDEDGS